jgi:putative DNA primase/helicase
LERERRVRAMHGARSLWQQAGRLRSIHPYVDRKGLSALGCAGLRERDGLLVVPVMYGESVISLQTISAAGEKRFHAGAPVRGGAFVLDRPRAAVTALVEGLATGLAVFQAVRQARVVVCFDAGNLLPVAERLRPTGSVVIAGDNDHQTFVRRGVNPGVDKARNVAEYLGCGVAVPSGLEGTDWADALKEWGEGAPRRIEREILREARYVSSG